MFVSTSSRPMRSMVTPSPGSARTRDTGRVAQDQRRAFTAHARLAHLREPPLAAERVVQSALCARIDNFATRFGRVGLIFPPPRSLPPPRGANRTYTGADGVDVEEDDITAQIEQAIAEGRLYGKFRCPRCGMSSNDAAEAAECCRDLGPTLLERVPASRFAR
jgi:hypothetical protein